MASRLPFKLAAALWEIVDLPLLHPGIKKGRMFFVEALVLRDKVSPPVWLPTSRVAALCTEG
jgi:hypothetical protein